jgi:hypothetical protein
MLVKKRSSWIGTVSRGIGATLLLLGCSGFARAAEVLVTAEFKPSALDPTAYRFKNTTPEGFYCAWRPGSCAQAGVYMFDLPITFIKTYTKGPSIRRRWYVGLPARR